jgi:membrane protease YdiL (CAAX protease family)
MAQGFLMAILIYILCSLTSLACAWLLLASYRRTRHRLLFWSGASFAAMTVNNVFLVLDKVVFPEVYLLPVRQASALVATLLLLFGLIYEKE